MNSVKGHIVDVVSREIYDGELVIRDGKIAVDRGAEDSGVQPLRARSQARVIPDIKMTDRHLMDTKNFKAIY